MANILVIEDEVNVSSFIKKGFEEEGHFVDVAYDGALGLNLACSKEYDVIVLDVVLPQINGLEVCKRYRENHGFSVPILMLTALGTTNDIVKGLQAGADDYLIKPFEFKELVARINVLLRHKGIGYTAKSYQIADLILNTETKIVTRSGITILLTLREFRLLEFLISNTHRVLSRTSIIENVWGSNMDLNTNIVEVYINYLRNKIDKKFPVKLIHTVVGMGYVLKE
jgi:two-component system, OmpR family, copper resistance phosphate regulon response regulator CusR